MMAGHEAYWSGNFIKKVLSLYRAVAVLDIKNNMLCALSNVEMRQFTLHHRIT
jgi:hypothetical protein